MACNRGPRETLVHRAAILNNDLSIFGKAMADLNSLVVFAKVVEASSFSEAARRLKMPVSTVSRRIAELEDQLGVRLLERSTRSLRLTELGAEVLEHAARSAELSEAVESIVSNRLSDVVGTLRLSAPPSIADTLLTPLVTAFQASYPNVRIQILVTDRFVDHIAEGVDLAFRFGALRDSSLVARRHSDAIGISSSRAPHISKGCKLPKKPQDLLKPPASVVFPLEARQQLGLRSQERQGQGDAGISAVPLR